MHYTHKEYRQWKKKPQVIDTPYGRGVSVAFTWQYKEATELAQIEGLTLIGGPGAKLLGVSHLDVNDAVASHNPYATFTSRGCIRHCKFCAVPVLEGQFRELSEWRHAPIVCDNNLLASSRKHFNAVIDSVLQFGWVDFNQGLDFRLLKPWHLDQLGRIKHPAIRLSFDNINDETGLVDTISMIRYHGYKELTVFILIGFNDFPEDALYRLNLCLSLKVWPFPMRYQPINAITKNSFVGEGWTDAELKRMMKYWANLRITRKIPYDEFDPSLCGKRREL